MRIAAIDQGTTSTRLLIARDDGSSEVRCSIRHQQYFPQPGWVEHDPLELLRNVETCLSEAGCVDGVGLANQGESCLAWDAHDGVPISPVIVWQDTRSADIVERLRTDGLETLTLERAGLPVSTYFSATKFSWILQHIPAAAELLRRGRLCLGTTDSFFHFRLTGQFCTDATTASRTSLMNLSRCEWDADLCRAFAVPVECLPEIRSTVSEYGCVPAGPVLASVVDQQAALYGHGCRLPGDSKMTFGTGAFMLCVTGSDVISAPGCGLLSTLAWRIGGSDTFALEGGVFSAGAAIEWALRAEVLRDVSELAGFPAPPAIGRGLVFVPAFSGLACPHWDPGATALSIGISAATTRIDLCQAILEGVALRAAEVIAAMDKHMPPGDCLPIDGGLSASPYFAQFLADVSRREIVVKTSGELAAAGCASLAAEALGCKLPATPSAARYYPGDVDFQAWRSRFSDAVARCGRWT